MKNSIGFLFLLFLSVSTSAQIEGVFCLYPMDYENEFNGAFVSLSDEQIGLMLPLDSIRNEESKIKLPRLLTKVEKNHLFNSMFFDSDDTVFIYNMFLDSIFKYMLGNTDLIEKEYSFDQTAIGFRIDGLPLSKMGNYYWNTFIHIGKTNPFQSGNVEQIIWNQVDSIHFPKGFDAKNSESFYSQYSRGNVFEYNWENYHYLYQELFTNEKTPSGRHLIVKDRLNNEIVFNYIFMNREGHSMSDFQDTGSKESNQWTGKAFNNLPPFLYGFLWPTFGCHWIDFLNSNKRLNIFCDNRH